jgi:hypothetical protein
LGKRKIKTTPHFFQKRKEEKITREGNITADGGKMEQG